MEPLKTTLPAKYYKDPAQFSAEMERFYFNQWICVGRTEELEKPGSYFLRDLAGESVIVVKGQDSRPRAFYNVCRHRGTQLCEEAKGEFKGSIQCRYHAWTWSLEGKMVGAPHMNDVPGFCQDDYPLNALHCDVWEGNIFVHAGKSPMPLGDFLGGLRDLYAPWKMGELKMTDRITYDVAANWKLIIQNYSECLHCPIIHPALGKLSNYLSGDNVVPSPHYFGGHMTINEGVETMSMSGKASAGGFIPGLPKDKSKYVYYYSLIPNLLLSAHPDYVMTHTLWPKSVNRTEIICEFHFHPEQIKTPGFSSGGAVDFWDMTNRQDWKVSELSQLGISSRGYIPGPYSKREDLLKVMDEVVLQGEA